MASVDLTTRYLGLTLPSPVIASAGPLTRSLDHIRELEDCGAGAVVMPSVFEEQIEQEKQLLERLETIGAESFPEALTYFPAADSAGGGLDRHLETLRQASKAVGIPVIASLNGITNRAWVEYARQMEQAGARAIELNIYFIPTTPDLLGREVEARYLDILTAVKRTVAIPVSVKLNPYFSALGHTARQLIGAGAAGLVLFNRFYQPDIDLARLELTPSLELSTPAEIRLPLLWIGLLAGTVNASLAASTGVDSAAEVIKYLLAGADVVMTTSALLKHGPGHMRTLVDGLKEWLAAREVPTPNRVRGSLSQLNVGDPAAFARANYIRVLQGY